MSFPPKRPNKLVAFMCIYLLLSCTENALPSKQYEQILSEEATIKTAELLAKQHCASCHEYVAPHILPKVYWRNVLPNMSMHLGIFEGSNPAQLNTLLAQKRLEAAHVFPSEPMISSEDWQDIKQFYLLLAPDTLNQGIRPAIDFDMERFNMKPIRLANNLKRPGFIKIIQSNKIAVGFSTSPMESELAIIDREGNELQLVATPSDLTSMSQISSEVYMSFMGALVADDNPIGAIGKMNIDRKFNLIDTLEIVLSARERPVHIQVADVNADGKQDLIVSEFGKYLGGLYVYLQNTANAYDKKVLYNGPGAISTIIKDVNKDGLPDLFVLVSQGREGIYLYTNKGSGNFEEKKILAFPPYYGSSHFEVVDFDRDGYDDIIYSNGDSGDFGMPAKPFHGIRFFKNQENESYKEEWFYPQQGTYKTHVLDFDQDGDFDIAAIGFFAIATIPEETFLYLENQGLTDGKTGFKTFSFPQARNSCYMVMDAGDIDNDGDIDLVLGASTSLMTISEMGKQLATWEKDGGLVVILENTLK